MLKLRRGTVVSTEPLVIDVNGERRGAWADVGLVGETRDGDEVIVNVEGLDLELGSGGFDVVHANLTRGLDGPGAAAAHVMKLNYTSLQHPVSPVEVSVRDVADRGGGPSEPMDPGPGTPAGTSRLSAGSDAAPPVLVLPLHGHLAPAAWAAHEMAADLRVGFIQTTGGALPGKLSRDLAELIERKLLVGDISAGPAYGGSFEAISVPGAVDAGARALEWDALIVGPGPGIIGSESRLGHGGMAALDSAHAALALGHPTLVSPRLSIGDPRPRHRGLSHHTATVLGLLLAAVQVPVPRLEGHEGDGAEHLESGSGRDAVEEIRSLCGDRHDVMVEEVDLDGYTASGLPARSMGRGIDEDPLFFAAALAAGRSLGRLAKEGADAAR